MPQHIPLAMSGTVPASASFAIGMSIASGQARIARLPTVRLGTLPAVHPPRDRLTTR